MKYEINKRFIKQFNKINSKQLAKSLDQIIENVSSAARIEDIVGIKKLKGYETCYRIRSGDYRIGIVYQEGIVYFWAVAHRSVIYNIFP